MASEQVQQAIALIKAGQRDAARRLLAEALRADPRDETAWAWLVESMGSDAQRLAAVRQWAKSNPESATARRALARLEPGRAEAPAPPVQPVPQPRPTPVAPVAEPPAAAPRIADSVTTPRPVAAWPPARIDPKDKAGAPPAPAVKVKPAKPAKPAKPPKAPKAPKPVKPPKPDRKAEKQTPPAVVAPPTPPPPESDFEALQDLRAGATRGAPRGTPVRPPRRRWPRIVVLLLALVAALGSLAIILRRQETERVAARATQQVVQATLDALATETSALSTEMARPTATPVPPTPTRTPTPIPTPSVVSETLSGMTTQRAYHSATLLTDGRVLLVGGSGSDGGAYLSSAEACDVATGTCTAVASMRKARDNHSATLLPDGRVLVVAGSNSDGWLRDAEIYDPEADRWRATNPPSPHGADHAAVTLADGRVLITGACMEGAAEPASSAASIFDPESNAWSKAAAMNQARCGHVASLLLDGRVLVAGGTDGQAELSSAEVYDPATDTWTATGDMATSRAFGTAVMLNDGKVLVAGGVSSGATLDEVEVFDPEGGSWSDAAPLPAARDEITLTRLANDRVLLTGGERSRSEWTEENYFDDAVVYDPADDVWGTPGMMVAARAAHTATLLPDGRVFVAGGLETPERALGDTEVLTAVDGD